MGESIAHAVCWRLLGICCPIRSQAACHAPNLDPSTQVLINSYVREQMILSKTEGSGEEETHSLGGRKGLSGFGEM